MNLNGRKSNGYNYQNKSVHNTGVNAETSTRPVSLRFENFIGVLVPVTPKPLYGKCKAAAIGVVKIKAVFRALTVVLNSSSGKNAFYLNRSKAGGYRDIQFQLVAERYPH